MYIKVWPLEPPFLGNYNKKALLDFLVGNLDNECNKDAPEVESSIEEP